MSFVTAFRGRRDDYQIPIALAECGQLECFLTDHFYGSLEALAAHFLSPRLAEKLRRRGDSRIEPHLVRRMRRTALGEALFAAAGSAPSDLYGRFDPRYGEAAVEAARRTRSDLLLYSAYAPRAFSAAYAHQPKKILFQFHPHIAMESALMRADLASPVRSALAQTEEIDSILSPSDARILSDESWKLADQIICASSFTKQSLIEAGADSNVISVIPYGVSLPETSNFAPPDQFHALFVGTGTYRKGLHHLLSAWQMARLPASSRLTIVARKIEPDLLRLVRMTKGVEYHAGVSEADLRRLYLSTALFVMPSFVEGFGQVYLEALSHGLPVLGTSNSCLPDLGTPDEGLFVTPPGMTEALADKLERLSDLLHENSDIRRRARVVAERNDWARFRRGICEIAQS